MTRTISILATLALAALVGCGGDDPAPGGGNGGNGGDGGSGGTGGSGGSGGEQDLMKLYVDAVADAAVAEPSEVVDTLTAIDPSNPDLVLDMTGRVLMVTWTSYDGYDSMIGQEMPLGVEVWVTPGRALQGFCRGSGLQGDALSLRLEQLLGLPPGNGKDRVVELWVPTDGMFRPSPDLEINDSKADLDFPAGTPQEHIDWFDALKATSYGDDGYPWTRLGYTYDWSPDDNEVGLSEFVIRKGTTIQVESVTAQGTYCEQP